MEKIRSYLDLIDVSSSLSSQINKGSFLLTLLGYKGISLDYIQNKDLFDLNKLLKSQSLFYYDFSYFDEHESIVYFSLDVQLLADFKKNFEAYISGDNDYIEYIGNVLGFPSCCVKVFSSYFKDVTVGDMKYHMFDFISYRVNNSNYFDKDLDIFRGNRFIFHTPCTFSCPESKRISLITQKVLSKFSPLSPVLPYEYLFFQTNEYIRLSHGKNFIDSGVYYEYNESHTSKLFLEYKRNTEANLEFFSFDTLKKDVLSITFQ